MCVVCIPDGFAEAFGRLETQHGYTCPAATRSPFSTSASQLLSFHTLANSGRLSPLESTLTRTPCKSMKTRDFNPFRIRSYSTPLCNPLIRKNLTKHGGRGEGVDPSFEFRVSSFGFYVLCRPPFLLCSSA